MTGTRSFDVVTCPGACLVGRMVACIAIEPAFTFEANAIYVHYSRKRSVD